jgi:HSP20 family molecular chaperone IbpA
MKLPSDADTDNIKSKYENGVLTVSLPRIKNVEEVTKVIEIEGV